METTKQILDSLKSEILSRTGIKINARIGVGSYKGFIHASLPKSMWDGDAHRAKKEERETACRMICNHLIKLNVYCAAGTRMPHACTAKDWSYSSYIQLHLKYIPGKG